MTEGGCLCGSVRYRVEGEPSDAGICHCETCRRAASAPALPFATFPRASFSVTRGKPAAYRSSASVTRRFCGRCGSQLTYENDGHPTTLDIMIGSLDRPDAIVPTKHVWVGEKIAWDTLPGDRPEFSRSSGNGQADESGTA